MDSEYVPDYGALGCEQSVLLAAKYTLATKQMLGLQVPAHCGVPVLAMNFDSFTSALQHSCPSR